MRGGLRQARRSVARGAWSDALVVLWNEIEPARLAGDRSALRQIEGLARAIERGGDEAERREAERLLEALREAAAAGEAQAMDAHVGAEAAPVGAGFEGEAEPFAGMPEGEPADAEGQGRGMRIGSLVWLLLILAVVLVNLLSQIRD